MKFLRVIGTVMLGLAAFNGCSKELSRGKAKDILQKSFQDGTTYNVAIGPFCALRGLEVRELANRPPNNYRLDDVGPYLIGATLAVGGYVTFNDDPSQRCGVFYGYRTVLTAKGEQLRKDWKLIKTYPNGDEFYSVKIADIEVEKITGITSRDEETRDVEYIWKSVPTPLISAFPSLATTLKTEEQPATATLKHYDDGWRLIQ